MAARTLPSHKLDQRKAACYEGRTNLLTACQSGDVRTAEKMIAMLLARGGSPELTRAVTVCSRDGSEHLLTPLFCAAAGGHLHIVRKLIQGKC